jgi:multidrug efflux pump subunit AcrA (membrane-fusion protein)
MSDGGETNSTGQHPHHISRAKVTLVVFLLAVLVVAAWLAGYLPRRDRENAAAAAANEVRMSVPAVTTTMVRRAPADVDVVLPGSVSALAEASIYARAAGYVKKRYADIGDHVKAGQLLAEIEAPELDEQVAQARAALAQAKQLLSQSRAAVIQAEAQRDLANANAERYKGLVKNGAVSAQELDTQVAGAKSAEALVVAQEANVSASQENVTQAQANLDRIVAMQDFKSVRAPFAGVVTARNVEVGYLISSSGGTQGASPATQSGATGTTPASGNEIYRVAQLGTLRIFVGVPQSATSAAVAGTIAAVTFADLPGRQFEAKVTRTANALDPTARTLLTELQLPNTDGKLLPGMYATVRFRNHRDSPPLLVRGDALITSGAGIQVAVLTDAPEGNGLKKIHMQSVQSGRDYGAEMEIVGGLHGGETVVANPGDDVREGAIVKAEAVPPARGGSGR